MIKYKLNYCIGNKIEKVWVHGETDKFVIWNGKRYKKEQRYYSYHDTMEEALEKIIEIASLRLEKSTANIECDEREVADNEARLETAINNLKSYIEENK